MASQGKCRWNGNQDAKPARSCDDGRSMERVIRLLTPDERQAFRRLSKNYAVARNLVSRRRPATGPPVIPCAANLAGPCWANCFTIMDQNGAEFVPRFLYYRAAFSASQRENKPRRQRTHRSNYRGGRIHDPIMMRVC